MDLLHLVDRLEELIAGAQRMPIGSRAIVDRRRLLDLIDQMRVAIPDEVRRAREVVAQTGAIRRDSEEEARLIVARAEEQTARLLDEHHITRSARLRAEEIAEDAERQLDDRISAANAEIERRLDESRRLAEQQMSAADQYAHELLGRLERQLAAFQRSVHSGLEQLSQPLDGEAPVAPVTPVAPVAGSAPGLAGRADGGSPADAAAQAAALTDAILAAAGAAPRSVDEAERRASEELEQLSQLGQYEQLLDAGRGGFEDGIEDTRTGPFDAFDAFDAPDGPQPPRRAHLGELLRDLDPGPVPPADPGVIDDFAMPQLDDQRDEHRDEPHSPDDAPRRPSNGGF